MLRSNKNFTNENLALHVIIVVILKSYKTVLSPWFEVVSEPWFWVILTIFTKIDMFLAIVLVVTFYYP